MLRAEVNIDMRRFEDELEENLGTLKPCHLQGPMDKFATAIHPKASLGTQKRQQNINSVLFKEKTHQVHQYCVRWVYQSGIPFNVIDNDAFRMFCEGLGQFGIGWIPPTQYQLREPLLKEEEERIKGMLKSEEADWERHEVGAEKVVQVVTDNALNNVAAANMLKEKKPNIFWTGCAAHTIDLMLEAISKLPKFKKVIDQARDLTVFIYAHTMTLSMMRVHIKKKDIVRPGVTRFATNFLTLQSLLEKKAQLKTMFTCEEWDKCKYSKCVKGKTGFLTVMSPAFWNGVTFVLTVFGPLVKVLRIDDGEKKPSMGFIFGELLQAMNKIKLACNDLEKNYKPIFDIIDEKMKGRLDSSLHKAAYVLNPLYFYKDPSMDHDQVLIDGFMDFVETFYHGDYDKQDKVVNEEFNLYKTKSGGFGRPIALRGCQQNDQKYDPESWWSIYGCHVPDLQKLATRILSLTSSSSGCERNWSTFEGIHSKKRNRLDVNRLNSLVYVQFNAKLFNKRRRIKDKDIDVILDDKDESNVEEWLTEMSTEREEGNDDEHQGSSDELREDIKSDEEHDITMDIEFEPDSEQVVNMDELGVEEI